MNISKKNVGIAIAATVIGIAIIVTVAQPKKITYEPVTDIAQVRECVTKVTGKSSIDIEELTQDQTLFSNIYRYCLKTVDDIEGTLKALTQ